MNRYLYLFGIVVAGFLAVGMFQAKTGASHTSREISAVEREIVTLKEEIGTLEKEHDHLTRPDRIAKLAVDELGMGPARSYQMVPVNKASEAFGPLVDYEDDQ